MRGNMLVYVDASTIPPWALVFAGDSLLEGCQLPVSSLESIFRASMCMSVNAQHACI